MVEHENKRKKRKFRRMVLRMAVYALWVGLFVAAIFFINGQKNDNNINNLGERRPTLQHP